MLEKLTDTGLLKKKSWRIREAGNHVQTADTQTIGQMWEADNQVLYFTALLKNVNEGDPSALEKCNRVFFGVVFKKYQTAKWHIIKLKKINTSA